MAQPRGLAGMFLKAVTYPFRKAPVISTAATDQVVFGGAGRNALLSSFAEQTAKAIGIDPDIIKVAAPTAIAGVLGSLIGQGGLGVAIGAGLTVLNAVNNPESAAAKLATKLTGPTPETI